MYICLECGRMFEKPHHYVVTHGLDTPPYEEYDASPCCADNYADVYTCDGCMEFITDTYVKVINGDRYCSDCYRKCELSDEN